MKKILKNSIAVMLMLLLVCTVAFIASPEAAAADPGTTVSNPIYLTPDEFYTRYWTEDNDHLNCYCQIEVPERGYITFTVVKPLDAEGEAGTFRLYLYDTEGEIIWGADTDALQDSFSDSYVYKIGLDAGVYYMNIDPRFTVTSGIIPTDFMYSFTAASDWEVEPNGDRSYAMPIELDTMYKGVYCEELYDVLCDDYYSINLVAGKTYLLKVDNFAKLSTGSAYVKIFDPNGHYEAFTSSVVDDQEGKVYVWMYKAPMTGKYYVVMQNDGNSAPIEYKIGMYEYICEHRPSKDATCVSKAVCAYCDEEYGEYDSTNHPSVITLRAVDPTCTTAGKTEGKKCLRCNKIAVEQEVIPATGHKLTTLKAVAATCTKAGKTEGKQCTLCNKVTVAQKTVAAKGHKLTTLKAVAATCTKAGKTEGKKCSTCGTVTVAQKSVAAKGHSYKTTTTKATLSKNGKAVTKCTTCGNVSKTTTFYYPKTIKLAKTAYTYNGKAQKPAVTVKDSKGNTLKKDKDYTVKYESGCKATGKYTVTITFKGNYTGTKKLNFTIAPKTTSKITASTATTAITLKWSAVTGATGYRVEQYNASSKKWVTVKNVAATTLKVSKLKSGTTYKFRVRAFKEDESVIWGEYSKTFAFTTKLDASKITKLTTSKGKAALVWSNVNGENGYEVYASTKKDSGFKKVATTKANVTKATISKLASGKTCYFKVRAYKTVDGAKMYSAWSAVKSVKVK